MQLLLKKKENSTNIFWAKMSCKNSNNKLSSISHIILIRQLHLLFFLIFSQFTFNSHKTDIFWDFIFQHIIVPKYKNHRQIKEGNNGKQHLIILRPKVELHSDNCKISKQSKFNLLMQRMEYLLALPLVHLGSYVVNYQTKNNNIWIKWITQEKQKI